MLQIIWDVNPIAFSIGNFEIRWYGIMYALAFLASYFLVYNWFKKENFPLNKVANLCICFLIIGIIGARLGEFVFYDFDALIKNPTILFEIKKGGMASHGAFFAYLIFVFIYTRINKFVSFWWILDKLAIAGCLIVFFMRLGNLFNSELIGKATDLPFAFVFARVDLIPRHPTVLYEAIIYFTLFVAFYIIDKQAFIRKKSGMLFCLFLLILVPIRYFLEFTKEGASTSQSLNLVLVFLGLLSFVWLKKCKIKLLSYSKRS